MFSLVGIIVTSRNTALENDVLTYSSSLDPIGLASRTFACLLGERWVETTVHIAKNLKASSCPVLTNNTGKSASLGPW